MKLKSRSTKAGLAPLRQREEAIERMGASQQGRIDASHAQAEAKVAALYRARTGTNPRSNKP
ncbi:MAG: hypothetical protein AB7U95_37825 [Reyranella sp.]